MNNTIYSSFNARNLSFKQVSESFIPTKHLELLVRNESTMLMGPRGCGKTTLLKVLSPDAIAYVKNPKAKEILKTIKFISVYIPSDIQWKKQLDQVEKHLDNRSCEFILKAIVLLNVLVSLITLFEQYLKIKKNDDEERLLAENRICKNLNKFWNLDIQTAKTFRTIELKLLEHLAKLNEQTNRSFYLNESSLNFNSIESLLFNDFIDLIRIGVNTFEQELKLPTDTKWALCFDELELLPANQQNYILSLLRSTDQKFIFKITSTPVLHVSDTVTASSGNDYKPIVLWVYDESSKTTWRSFCGQFVSQKFKVDSINDLNSIFGSYVLDEIIIEELKNLLPGEKMKIPQKFSNGTGPNSTIYYLFKLLALRDKSFKEFLIKRDIDPTNPISNEVNKKSIFLKHKSEAVQRLIFKNRTRKSAPIHYGLPYLYDLCDGNPRLLVGMYSSPHF